MFMHNTALALAGLKRYNAALEKWDEAAGMSGVSVRDAGRIMLARGWVYEQMGDPFRTEQMYSDLIELAGADPELCARALQLRAVLRIKAGCIGSALPDLQRILELPVALEKKEKAASALNALKKIPEAEAPGIF
jgi:tetratricopeptide (TPR) repeat protein